MTALAAGLAFAAFISAASAATLEVGAGKPYTNIQAAVTAAGTGDTVLVYSGIYTEQVTIATTAGSGMDQVHQLLGMLLGAVGVQAVATLETHGYFPKTLKNPEEARQAAHTAADKIYPYLAGEKQVESDPQMEECFQMMKQKSVMGREWLPADYAYWEKNGMLDINTYADLLKKPRAPVEQES